MIAGKKMGIYMDHAHAELMQFVSDDIQETSVKSDFTHQDKVHTLNRSEVTMHHKEQHEQAQYYKNLADVIREQDTVILFGPTEAKEELYNTIKDNPLFSDVKISIHKTDKLTEHQKHAFVKDYFEQ